MGLIGHYVIIGDEIPLNWQKHIILKNLFKVIVFWNVVRFFQSIHEWLMKMFCFFCEKALRKSHVMSWLLEKIACWVFQWIRFRLWKNWDHEFNVWKVEKCCICMFRFLNTFFSKFSSIHIYFLSEGQTKRMSDIQRHRWQNIWSIWLGRANWL